jgi:hypothetical protein
MNNKECCEWTPEHEAEDHAYTSCGTVFQQSEGETDYSWLKFCFNCGKPVNLIDVVKEA